MSDSASRPHSRRALVRQVAGAASLAVAGASLGACADQKPVAPSGSGKVEFWQLYQGSPAIPHLRDLLQRKYPLLQVELVDVAGGQMSEKLTVASAANTAPDGMAVNAPFFRDCARLCQPLDSFLKRDSKKIDAERRARRHQDLQ